MNPPASMMALYLAQRGLCFHCDKKMLMGPVRKKKSGVANLGWTREHIVPASRGGKKGDNIVLAHLFCNVKRGNAEPTYEMRLKARQIHDKASRFSRKAIGHVMSDPGLRQAALGHLWEQEP